jgi:1-hydroxy-2-naphthoate dioxygenase
MMATEAIPGEATAHQTADTLAAFEAELASQSMEGHWQEAVNLPHEPYVHFRPNLWKWDVIERQLFRAGELVPIQGNDARRTLRLLNPGRKATTHTIHMSVQLVKPGEIAGAHRHTLAALRFVVQGAGASTTVEGERFRLRSGDLILTPQWTYHDHANDTAEPIIWLDGLDSPLVMGALDALFFEEFSAPAQPITRPDGWTLAQSGLARPVRYGGTPASPTAYYPWAQIEPELLRLAAAEGSPHDGAVLEYVNPFPGRPTMPTIGCWVQLLRPGERTRRHRHTSCSIYHVVRGRGCTTVGDTRLEWTQGDVFTVPNWSWHAHENASPTEDAVLFSMNDIPIYQAFGLYREQAE